MSRRIEVTCLVDIEQTAESFHAHAIPEEVDLQPGDTVIVHNAPQHIRFGERLQVSCRATVIKAGPFLRLWTQITGLLELSELYEVGFQPKEVS